MKLRASKRLQRRESADSRRLEQDKAAYDVWLYWCGAMSESNRSATTFKEARTFTQILGATSVGSTETPKVKSKHRVNQARTELSTCIMIFFM